MTQFFNQLFVWLKARLCPPKRALSDYERARQLINAVDRGGIPLNAAKVNALARDLGLEVSRTASMEETIGRIRLALDRETRHE